MLLDHFNAFREKKKKKTNLLCFPQKNAIGCWEWSLQPNGWDVG